MTQPRHLKSSPKGAAKEETIVSMSDAARRAKTEALPAGTKLGKYQLRQVLGQGGMGTVYLAIDMVLKREVALKVLPADLTSDEAALKRFIREAQLAARLNHVNAVTVYDVNRENDAYFIAMELVRGPSTDEVIKKSGPMPVEEGTRIIADACRALIAAHAAGLIHRDIKPANILRAHEGTVKLTDFGLAKLSTAKNVTVTEKNVVLGTPHYMSPEQCQNEPLDARSDLYSLGATYYALITGSSPYTGGSAMQILFAHCTKPVPDPREVSSQLPALCTRIVQKAMAKRAGDRYQSAEEMLADLEKLLGKATAASPAPAAEVTPEFAGLLDALEHETAATPVRNTKHAPLQQLPELPGLASAKRRRNAELKPYINIGIGVAVVVVLLCGAMWLWPRGGSDKTPHDPTAAQALASGGTQPESSKPTSPANPAPASPVTVAPIALTPTTGTPPATPVVAVPPANPPADAASQLPSPLVQTGDTPPATPATPAIATPLVTASAKPPSPADAPLPANDPFVLRFQALKAAYAKVRPRTPEFRTALDNLIQFDNELHDAHDVRYDPLSQQVRDILEANRPDKAGAGGAGAANPPQGNNTPADTDKSAGAPAPSTDTPSQPLGPKTQIEKRFDVLKQDVKTAVEGRNRQRIQRALASLSVFEREFRSSSNARIRELATEAKKLMDANRQPDDAQQPQPSQQPDGAGNQQDRPQPPRPPRRP